MNTYMIELAFSNNHTVNYGQKVIKQNDTATNWTGASKTIKLIEIT